MREFNTFIVPTRQRGNSVSDAPASRPHYSTDAPRLDSHAGASPPENLGTPKPLPENFCTYITK
jgi:hypothetical protein